MDKRYEALFTPWKIGNVEIKNRIVLCPMGGTSLFGWVEPHHFDKEAAAFFLKRAENNVGLIIPGIAPLRNMLGNGWLYKANGAFKRLKPFMEKIHATGAKLFVQLTAGFGRSFALDDMMALLVRNKVLGALARPVIDPSYLCAAPSASPSRWAEDTMCREMTLKEIKKIIFAYAETAKKLMDAGVDGVEVHAVHEGYLLDQFTLKYVNKRTDEYGGSFENRYRFAVEVVQAIKARCGKDFPVSLRYSVVSKTKGFCSGAVPGEEFEEAGRDMAESEKAIKYLEEAGYDMFNADNGTYDAWYWAHPPAYMPENCNLEDVAHIKKFTNAPVVAAGRMSPAVASEAIAAGRIDGMGVARQFLTDPEWVTKLLEDREEDIHPCICCHNGCFTMSKAKGTANTAPLSDTAHMARCALNPETMQSYKYFIKPASVKKKVAVIGGGIGGMEAARVLKKRGHDVTVYEKSDRLGGVFIPAAAPSFKEKDRELIRWYIRQIEQAGIKVEFNAEIKDLSALDADEIIVATGSTPKRPRIPGIEKSIEAIEFLNGEKQVGDRVVVIGGGLTGSEIAYELSLQGKHPVIVEALNDIITTKAISLANSSYLRDYFKWKKVPLMLESTVTEIGDGFVSVKAKDGTVTKVEADSVITGIGYNPAPIAANDKRVHVIGDALKVGNLRTVIWGAWDVAMKI